MLVVLVKAAETSKLERSGRIGVIEDHSLASRAGSAPSRRDRPRYQPFKISLGCVASIRAGRYRR